LDREAREQVNPAYSVITPLSSVGLSFADRTHAADYGAWPKLPEIFPVSFAGSQTARDSALIDIDVTRLEKRMESYLNPSVSDEAIRANIPALMIAKKRFQPVSVRRTLLNVGSGLGRS